jgi:hypothetical protein
VTGHRELPDQAALCTQVRRVLERIAELFPPTDATPVVFTVVSPLAEGADRLVAEEVLKLPGSKRPELEAALPLPPDEYRRDFTSSGASFDKLLETAVVVWIAPDVLTREEGYERAGKFVVDRSDVLIALWDGQMARGQGGTAEAVAYAAEQGVPVFWIDTCGSHEIHEQPWCDDGRPATPRDKAARPFGTRETPVQLERTREAFDQLDEYNRLRVRESSFRQAHDGYLRYLVPSYAGPALRARLQALAAWALPGLVRADLLAKRYQRTYNLLSDLLLLLAAFAVTNVAAQVIFLESTWLIWVEVLLPVSLLLIVLVGRWRRYHARWISYRSLAEAFRSAFFLAAAGVGAAKQESHGGTSGGLDRLQRSELAEPSERWFQRAFSEAWKSRPAAELSEADVSELRRFLSETWVEDQISWHRRTRTKYRQRHRQLTYLLYLLFGATLLLASMHLAHVGESEATGAASFSDWNFFLSIALPAFGAAVTGIREQRHYLLHAERYGHLADRLERLARERLDTASDLGELRAVAAEAQRIMLEENLEWSGVVELQELEVA